MKKGLNQIGGRGSNRIELHQLAADPQRVRGLLGVGSPRYQTQRAGHAVRNSERKIVGAGVGKFTVEQFSIETIVKLGQA